jgi:hypothetical protein
MFDTPAGRIAPALSGQMFEAASRYLRDLSWETVQLASTISGNPVGPRQYRGTEGALVWPKATLWPPASNCRALEILAAVLVMGGSIHRHRTLRRRLDVRVNRTVRSGSRRVSRGLADVWDAVTVRRVTGPIHSIGALTVCNTGARRGRRCAQVAPSPDALQSLERSVIKECQTKRPKTYRQCEKLGPVSPPRSAGRWAQSPSSWPGHSTS